MATQAPPLLSTGAFLLWSQWFTFFFMLFWAYLPWALDALFYTQMVKEVLG